MSQQRANDRSPLTKRIVIEEGVERSAAWRELWARILVAVADEPTAPSESDTTRRDR
jgi:hypothetical protein